MSTVFWGSGGMTDAERAAYSRGVDHYVSEKDERERFQMRRDAHAWIGESRRVYGHPGYPLPSSIDLAYAKGLLDGFKLVRSAE